MAKKDFIAYYKQCQDQYLEMRDNVKELEEALKGQFISQERFDEAKKEIDIVKNNYETLSYVVMLLNIPLKEDKRKKYNEDNKHIFDYLVNVSKEEMKKKNDEAIKKLKQMCTTEVNNNGN